MAEKCGVGEVQRGDVRRTSSKRVRILCDLRSSEDGAIIIHSFVNSSQALILSTASSALIPLSFLICCLTLDKMVAFTLSVLVAISCVCAFASAAVRSSPAAFAFPDPTATSKRRFTSAISSKDGQTTKAQAAVPTALVAAALVASASLGLPLPSSAAADVAHGASLFKADCAGCHLGGSNFMSEKKTLKKDALAQYQSLDASKLQAFVQDKMPHSFLPFHSKWSDQDYEDAVGYVLDQAVNDKWE